MLKALIISPDPTVCTGVSEILEAARGVAVLRVMTSYPAILELTRFVRAHAPQVIFIGIDSFAEVRTILDHLEQVAPGMQIVALHRVCDSQTLLNVMHAGIRELLAMPFKREDVESCLARVAEHLEKKPVEIATTDLVFSFLPAKPGVGTSTIALNTASALSKLDKNPLLMDFDLNCGITRFMMKLDNPHSVVDAAKHASEMDEDLWKGMVTKVAGMDILHSGRIDQEFRIEQMQVRHLMSYTRRNYTSVCVDLSGNMEKYSLEIMHESKRIFLVCTPEVPVLHLAREKHEYLRSVDLADRAILLLNRTSKKMPLTVKDVEKIVGLPVFAEFPNDYTRVTRAMTEGKPVEDSSDFAKACNGFARNLCDVKADSKEHKRRFVEYFTISPARFAAAK